MPFHHAPLRIPPPPPLWRTLLLIGLLVLIMAGSLYLPVRLSPLVDVIWSVCAIVGVVVVAQRMSPPSSSSGQS